MAAVLVLAVILAVACDGTRSTSPCDRDDWPGPWSACPDAAWTRQAAAAAGYRVVGETGSALVVGDGAHSFYLWATRNGRTAEARWRQHPPLVVVGATPVYGDRDLWRYWRAGPFAVWVQEGPTADAVLPRPRELAPLVEATVRLAPPG